MINTVVSNIKMKDFFLLSSLFVLNVSCSIELGESPVGSFPGQKLLFDRENNGADYFKCLDGSDSISFSEVNDDYCDCKDGSDEPGTNACPFSFFYCKNDGYLPKNIFSSRVNDGICDCCDGSDEYQQKIKCVDACFSLGKSDREEKERIEKIIDEATIIKSKLIIDAKKIEEEKRDRLKELEKVLQEEEKNLLKMEKLKNKHLKAELNMFPERDEKIMRKVDRAREKYDKSRWLVKNLTIQVESITKFFEQDFGPDGEFSHLESKCYQFVNNEYEYIFCPFKKITQSYKNQEPPKDVTRLGNWGEWDGPEENKYEIMLYENGKQCWNGSARLVRVKLVCDLEEKILTISEPNKCEYFLKFSTPAACKNNNINKIHDEL